MARSRCLFGSGISNDANGPHLALELAAQCDVVLLADVDQLLHIIHLYTDNSTHKSNDSLRRLQVLCTLKGCRIHMPALHHQP